MVSHYCVSSISSKQVLRIRKIYSCVYCLQPLLFLKSSYYLDLSPTSGDSLEGIDWVFGVCLCSTMRSVTSSGDSKREPHKDFCSIGLWLNIHWMVFAYLRRSSWKLDLVLIFNLRKSLSEINGECIMDNIKNKSCFYFQGFHATNCSQS